MILELIDGAVAAGSGMRPACEVLGLSARSVQRWREQQGGEDRRLGPRIDPPNKLSEAERQEVLNTANSPEYRELSPKQIVPSLADHGIYLASESTFYRILREEEQMVHREPSRPATHSKPREHVATGPCQVWSWDITYLRTAVRGQFYYLYMVEDVWSRKIVGWAVHREESMDLASELAERICEQMGIDATGVVLHSDNGGPMKGSTMLATLQRLGIIPSFSRPKVSDDNPYSEALFRTMKYRPEYPRKPFESIEQARAWVSGFVQWYNTEHLHSAIRFVTPDDRHYGKEKEILEKRRRVYEAARRRHPNRWTGRLRNWESVEVVYLNPDKIASDIMGAVRQAA